MYWPLTPALFVLKFFSFVETDSFWAFFTAACAIAAMLNFVELLGEACVTGMIRVVMKFEFNEETGVDCRFARVEENRRKEVSA